MQAKEELRITMLAKRDAIDRLEKENYDRLICGKIEALVADKSMHTVHLFIPMGNEIDLVPLINRLLAKGITLVTPKALRGRKMDHLVLRSLSELEEGMYGTHHPASAEIYTGKIDLIIVPGLAFDRAGYRLGYGAGYYDEFLSTQQDALKIGICYPFQVVDKVPVEAHDVRLDGIFY